MTALPARPAATAVDSSHRRLHLARALKLLALAATAALLVPLAGFLGDTLNPDHHRAARPGGVTVEVADLASGEIREVRWHGRTVWIHRAAGAPGAAVAVLFPFESLRGCKIHPLPAGAPEAPPGWKGGFSEPCFGALFDGAGRHVPGTGRAEQTHLEGPPHALDDEGRVTIGPAT